MDQERYEEAAAALIGARIAALRSLTFDQAAALEEAHGEETLVADQKCALTTFRQTLRPNEILVTVQVARPALLGMASVHTERGLVFSRDGSVREATQEELQNSGG